jgi:flagellar assembly protein FliH
MTGFVPKEMLTAYQRWEVAAFDEAEQAAAKAAKAAAAAPALVEQEEQEAQEQVVFPTAAEIEQMHAEAHQQGYDAGYQEGITQAAEIVSQMDGLMSKLQQALQELDQHVAEQLLATAVEIAKQVVRQNLQLQPELLLPVVREAVATLHPHQGHPLLIAHPDDAALIRTHLGEQLAHNNWRIMEDASITPGGCRVELGASEVDATLETRWRRVLESIGISQDWLSNISNKSNISDKP